MNKDIAVINEKLDSITTDISEIKSDVKDLRNNFVNRRELEEIKGVVRQKVSKKEFEVVKLLVFSFVGIVLIAFIGGLVSLVFIK